VESMLNLYQKCRGARNRVRQRLSLDP
jgi:hypothetical protein